MQLLINNFREVLISLLENLNKCPKDIGLERKRERERERKKWKWKGIKAIVELRRGN